MTPQKIIEVVHMYDEKLARMGVKAKRVIDDVETNTLPHCRWMLLEIEKHIRNDRLGKAFRWLGFVQGVLWTMGIYTLEDLKNHNRPK